MPMTILLANEHPSREFRVGVFINSKQHHYYSHYGETEFNSLRHRIKTESSAQLLYIIRVKPKKAN